jgi:hypothetical protein
VKLQKFILVFLLFSKAFAQVDNSSLFFTEHEFDTTRDEAAYIKFQGLGFMKDIENFGPIIDGYTLFGLQFNPQIGYQFSKNFALEGGVYLHQDFGHKNINEVLPTFSLRYQKNDLKMIFGNLNGAWNHKLIEPLYAFERGITRRMETGAQFLLNKKRFDFDIWIDWQNMLYRLVNDYERFWLGMNWNVCKFENDKFEFRIPLQGTARHNGGQIARGGLIYPDYEGVYTNLNGAAGLYFKKKFAGKHLKSICFDGRYVANQNNSRDTTLFKSFGDGALINIGAEIFKTDFMLSYWYGGDYTSEFGGQLYNNSSSSLTYAGVYANYRNLFIFRATRKIPLAKQAILTIRLEPMYDLTFQRIYFDMGFYINFGKQIFLKK